MYLSYGTVALLFLAVLIVWFWQDSLRVRHIANGAAMDACAQLGLQFLDGTVAFSKLNVTREMGRLRLRRIYVFDYTAHSIGRLQGFVVLRGAVVETVGFARHETHQARAAGHDTARFDVPRDLPRDSAATPPSAKPVDSTRDSAGRDPGGKVLQLDEWRRSRNERH
jgi:hypothetical protein